MNKYQLGRVFLRDTDRDEIDFSKTDQSKGIIPPPIEKPYTKDDVLIPLPSPEELTMIDISLSEAIRRRKSLRRYAATPLTLEELSYLIWNSHGIRRSMDRLVLRTAPSAGNRHAIDTYLSVHRVEGLEKGIYRYLPLEHSLILVSSPDNLEEMTTMAARDQIMAGNAAVTFFWVAVPYRMEWRYDYASYKVIALDAGHICQNLYLAAEAIDAGVCAIAAYDQDLSDKLLGLDGYDELVIYMASVGKKDRITKF